MVLSHDTQYLYEFIFNKFIYNKYKSRQHSQIDSILGFKICLIIQTLINLFNLILFLLKQLNKLRKEIHQIKRNQFSLIKVC